MEISLKNFIAEGQGLFNQAEVVEETKKKVERAVPHIEIVLENDTDFILRRSTSKTSSMLVCILSQGMIYIKNEKTGDVEKATAKNVINFLNATDYNYVDNAKFKQLKWSPWEKGYSTPHLTNCFTFALRQPENMKILVNHKLFLSDNCFSKNGFVSSSGIIDNKEKMEKITREIIFAQECLLTKDVRCGNETISSILFFFDCLEKQGVNFDKVKYNAEKMKRITEELEDSYWWNFSKYSDKTSTFITDYNIEFNYFIDYVLYLLEMEGLTPNFSSSYRSYSTFPLTDYIDYLKMQKEMYGKVREKYPENWLTEHTKLLRTYNAWKKLHENELVFIHSAEIEKYLYKNDTYTVLTPKSSSDVVDEGYQLGHCVASYVSQIAEGETNIAFVRYNDKLEESLLTIEIKDGRICQCRGKGNRYADEKERLFLEEWSNKVGLVLDC